mgnify:FL=1
MFPKQKAPNATRTSTLRASIRPVHLASTNTHALVCRWNLRRVQGCGVSDCSDRGKVVVPTFPRFGK